MVTINSRGSWGAIAGDGNGSRPTPTRTAWLHHSVTPHLSPTAGVKAEREQMRYIERIGVQRFGAHYGFPYTFAIFPSLNVYEGHAFDQRGAHTAGHNTDGIGIVWPGNYDTQRAVAGLPRRTAELLVDLKRAGKIQTAALDGGHRDSREAVRLAGPTACPGKYAHALVDDINRIAAELLGRPTPAPPKVDQLGRYRIRPGDTLGEIAREHRTSVGALVLLNGISDPDRISAGDTLYTRWVVGRGDTLSEIATRTGTTVRRLVELNGIRNADSINVGQLIRLP